MANVNNPHGLRPLMRSMSGGPPQTRECTKAVGYAAAIKQWDPVTELAGVLNGPASGITPGTTRYLGVALNYSPASVAAKILVIEEPGAIYEAQGNGTALVVAVMGYNANLTSGALTGPTPIISGVEIADAGIAVTSTLDVKVLELLNVPDNAYGANARVELRFNKHLRNQEVTVT